MNASDVETGGSILPDVLKLKTVWDPDRLTVERYFADLRQAFERADRSDVVELLLREVAELKAAVEMLGHAYWVLAKGNALQDRLVPESSSGDLDRTLAEQILVQADHNLAIEDGFHNVEYDERGLPYRWTGPDREFGFDLYVSRARPLGFTMTTVPHPRVDPGTIRCSVGHQAVPLQVRHERGKVAISGTLPPDATLGRTRLTFVVQRTFSPAAIDPTSGDSRVLGIPFVSLEVRPTDAPAASKAAGSPGPAPTAV